MKKLLLLIFIISSVGLQAQIRVSNNCQADIASIEKEWKQNQGLISEKTKEVYPINTFHGTEYLSILVQVTPGFDSNALESEGIMVGSRVGNIVSIKYPLSLIEDIYEMEGVNTLQVAGKIKPDLNKVLYDTRVDSVHAGIGLPAAFTGKDVLIGVTDWGFDYSHPMFYDTLLESTRILAAWDQFKTAGPAPDGYDYGTEYNTQETLIAAGSDTNNIYSVGTHGTHVAGIAGGSGAGTIYRGMAFESQFLFTTFLVDEGAVLDAWEWMYNKAQDEDKRLVINMSWGLYHTGALDGTSMLSEAINTYSGMGVLFVTSGGNNGDVDFHIRKDFDNDTLRSRILFYDAALEPLWGQSIHAWGDVGASFSAGFQVLNAGNVLQVETPWYHTDITDTYVDSFVVVTATEDTIWYNLSMDDEYPSNGRPQMRLRIRKASAAYRIVLKSTAETGRVHYWNVTELVTDVGNWGMPFASLGEGYTEGDNTYGIGAPACTESAISVAAFSASFETDGGTIIGGGPATFSSVGPIMTEELKPDISAPGVSVGSSVSSYTDASFFEITSVDFEGREYPFARFSGTSMSSPAVAGISALLLEANPYLSPWQVKIIIIQTAREDEFTGEIPEDGDHKWGWGKIHAYNAIKKALNTTGLVEVKEELNWTVYPNPAQDLISLGNLPTDVKGIQIFGLDGKVYGQYGAETSLDVSNLASGTYIIRIQMENRVEQQKFIVR